MPICLTLTKWNCLIQWLNYENILVPLLMLKLNKLWNSFLVNQPIAADVPNLPSPLGSLLPEWISLTWNLWNFQFFYYHLVPMSPLINTSFVIFCKLKQHLHGLTSKVKTIILKAFKSLRFKTWFCSTKGVGGTAPDLAEAQELENGVLVPLGKPKAHPEPKVQIFLFFIFSIFWGLDYLLFIFVKGTLIVRVDSLYLL